MQKKLTLALEKHADGHHLVVNGETSRVLTCKVEALNAITVLSNDQLVKQRDVFNLYKEIADLPENELRLLPLKTKESDIPALTARCESSIQIALKIFEATAPIDDCPPESYFSFNCGACEKIHASIIDKDSTVWDISSKEGGHEMVEYLTAMGLLSAESAEKIPGLINAEEKLPEIEEPEIVVVQISFNGFQKPFAEA